MTTDELLKRLAGFGGDVLDELVHEAASQLAADANNRGTAGQVAFLLERGYTPDEILHAVIEGGGQ